MKTKSKVIKMHSEEEVDGGYTLIFSIEDEIGYKYVGSLKEAEADALSLIDGMELVDGEDYSNVVFIAKGKVEPLKVVFTKNLKII